MRVARRVRLSLVAAAAAAARATAVPSAAPAAALHAGAATSQAEPAAAPVAHQNVQDALAGLRRRMAAGAWRPGTPCALALPSANPHRMSNHMARALAQVPTWVISSTAAQLTMELASTPSKRRATRWAPVWRHGLTLTLLPLPLVEWPHHRQQLCQLCLSSVIGAPCHRAPPTHTGRASTPAAHSFWCRRIVQTKNSKRVRLPTHTPSAGAQAQA